MEYIFVTDEELAELPEDDKLAVMEYYKIATEKLEELTVKSVGSYHIDRIRAQYMTDIIVLLEKYRVTNRVFPQIAPETEGFDENFELFCLAVRSEIQKIRLEMRTNDGFRKDILAPNTKRAINNSVKKLKYIINNSTLADSHKSKLIKKLEEFEIELNSSRSNLKKYLLFSQLLLH